jgi:hypothetical protein
MSRFALSGAVAIVLVAAVYGGLVLTEPGQRLENLGLAGAELRGASDRAESLDNLSHISVLAFGGAILFVFGVALARRRANLGLLAGAVMALSVVIAEVLKDVLPRPELFPAAAWLMRNTFPSGHATVAAAIGVGAILVSPDRVRWLVVPAAAIYASAIGQATQVAGWHRLSGAVAGVLLVTAVASLALVVAADRGHLHRLTSPVSHPRATRILLGLAGGIVAIGAVIALLPLAFPLLTAPRDAASAFAHTSLEVLGFGVSMAAIVAFGALLEPFSVGEPDDVAARREAPLRRRL